MNERIFILIGKKKAGEATDAELRELEELLTGYRLSGYGNEVLDKLWSAELEEISDNHPGTEGWNKIRQRIGRPAGIFVLSPWKKWVVAASLVLGGCFLVWSLQQSGGKHRLAAPSADGESSQFITQPRSKSRLQLPDGTQVWMNENSKLTYNDGNFGTNIREVYLSGEAFFDVTRNEKVPFVIHAGPVNITVKGTAFNVKCYAGQKTIETSLLRGLIEITTQQDPDRRIIVKPNEKIIIPAEIAYGGAKDDSSRGDAKPVYAISSLHKLKSEVLPETVWMQNRLVFDNELFENLIPQFESWFNVRITILYDDILKKRFSGVIEKETLKETLSAMQLSFPFDYRVDGNELVIIKKK
jgi:ferric-dicitrate binding protein FerR (iron transport regulator)